ncbi:MFS transporter [Streptomyces venezuelae]|uniref:MFS transporter n=1 Tax=Streptomyces venezuelae TaxID=54571 RepID=UPI003329B3BA
MTGSLDLPAARRRYVTLCALFWLAPGLSLAPLILLLTERGMAMATIAGLFAAHSLTAAALELPTGGLADVLGRRAVLVAAGLLNLTALALVGLGSDPWLLGVGMVLMGAGRALASGPAEAWYVDTVHAHSGPDADLRPGLAGGASASSAALAAGTLLGGVLPWLLGAGPDLGARLREASSGLVLPLSVPLLLGAVVEIGFVLYVWTALPEPPRPPATLPDVLRGIPSTVVGGLRLAGRDTLVRRVFLGAGAAGSALVTIELLVPGRAAAVTGASESGAVLFSVLACCGFICSGLGSQLAPLTARLAGSGERAVMVSLGAGASGLLLLGATAAFTGAGALVLSATGYGLLYLGLGAAGPNQNDILHRRVTSAGRATALSVQSLAPQLLGALTGLVVGVLRPGPVPWLLGGVALLAGSLLWARRSSPTPPARQATPRPPAASSSRPGRTAPSEI